MRRSEYWITSIGLAIIRMVATFAGAAVLGVNWVQAGNALPLRIGLDLLFLWPYAAVAIKRGHDRNRPAAYTGALLAAMYGLSWISAAILASGLFAVVGVISLGVLALALYMLVDYGFIDGTQGPNRYGPSPKGIGPQHREQDVATVFE